MFGRGSDGDAVIVARQTHEGSYRKGINVQAATGLYHHVYDFVADVTPDAGGEVFRATFTELFESDTEHRPVPGETVRVKISKSNEVSFDRKALWEWAKADKAADHASFAAVGNAAPNTGTTARVPKPTGDPKVDLVLFGIMMAQEKGDAAEVERLQTQLAIVQAGGEPELKPTRSAAAADPLDQIAKAAELHASGALSDEEFAALKAKLLG